MRIRKLFVEVTTKWLGEAKLKASKAAGDAAAATFRELSQVADTLADRSERAAVKLTEMARAAREAAAAGVRISRVMADGAAPASPRAPRTTPPRSSPRSSPSDGGARSAAAVGGLQAGAATINEATKALGPLASAADRAKARISDLTAQVARNREEMARLKAQAIQTGDADGTLAARMKGLATATLDAQGKLSGARRELRGLEGGFIETVKRAADMQTRMTALGTALGNLGYNIAAKGFQLITDAIGGSIKSAIDFQTEFTRISKVVDDKSPENLAKIDADIKQMSKSLGVMPNEIAAMSSALAASGLQGDLTGYTEDAAKLGVAFDLSGQEAGHAIASLTASLGLSRGGMQSLMGTINELDDGMNSSSKQLVKYLEGVAGIGRAASISGETMLALGSAVISTGVDEDKAATGVKNFIATLESGTAATDHQLRAFKKLGLNAVEVANAMAGGKAEEQIKAVAKALETVPPPERFGVLIDLFGRESIGSVGGLATNVNLLGDAFKIAGDKASAATSVQDEYNRVSQTSAHKIEKRKANIGVLAIELGDALLPHIDKVVEFLTSPEGQEWGKGAVEKAVGAVTTLASAIGGAVSVIATLVDTLGGAEVAVLGLGIAVAGLAGPWGVAAAAAAIAIKEISLGLGQLIQKIPVVGEQLTGLRDRILGIDTSNAKKGADQVKRDVEDDEWERKQAQGGLALQGGRSGAYGEESERGGVVPMAGAKQAAAAASVATATVTAITSDAGSRARFEALAAKVRSGQGLRESERKELKKLTTALDEVRPTKNKKPTHNLNEEQRRLAAEERGVEGRIGDVLDGAKQAAAYRKRLGNASSFKENFHLQALAGSNPELAKVLAQGRGKNEKGKLGKPQNELDKLLEDRILNGPTAHGVSGSRGSDAVAPPAISNTIHYNMSPQINLGGITVEPAGDTSIQNIRGAAAAAADVVVTGWKEAAIIFNGR